MDFDTLYEAIDKHRILIACAVSSVVGIAMFKRFFVYGTKCTSKARMINKTVLITGANTGIGKETAMVLARRGARVLIACRNISKAEDAASDIRQSTGNNNVEVYELDLASLKSVRKCAEEVIARENRLDVLINNAVVGIAMFKRFFVYGTKCTSKARMINKTVLITGANTGIGKETAMDLARRGARVLIACRNISKAEDAASDIRQSTGNNNVEVYELDLASLKSVRKCAEEVIARENRLDVLINNAGVMNCPYWKTEDGFEMQIGTNHFGHFLLTNLLLDLLKKSAPSRIVVVSSRAHTRGKINFDDLHSEKGYNSFTAYGQSKLANNLFCRELNKRLQGTDVTVNSLHPGVIATELPRHLLNSHGVLLSTFFSAVMFITKPIFMKTPVQGAQTTIHLAVAEELEGVSGKYFSDCVAISEAKAAYDEEVAAKLWEVSEKAVGLLND